jgi:hypothetical protein
MKVKGSALRSTLNFVREHFPPDQVEKMLQRIPPDHRKLLERPILVSDWHEAAILVGLMKAAAAASGEEGRALWHRMGRQSADDGLNTVYKVFFRLGAPSYILKRGFQLWNNYYSDGVMVVENISDRGADVKLTKNAFPDECMCVRITGWMERSIELSGGKGVAIRHKTCVHRGDPECAWRGDWA